MAKKHMGRWLALAAVAGAAAVGISYFRKYRSFNKELEEDFHDFEDEGDDMVAEEKGISEGSARKYVSLHANKDEFKVAAGDMLGAAKDMAGAAKGMVKDTAAILSDAAGTVSSAARDTAQMAKGRVKDMAGKAAVKTAGTAEKAASTTKRRAPAAKSQGK